MTARPNHDAFIVDAFVRRQEQKSLLRLVACGAVDHGKSSLLGRLLYEAKVVFDDQIAALARDTSRHDVHADGLDFSLLLDGLAAEREQKITIDVAYRFFATERRKYIVADAPGHEQYTRNMATGASTADVALILVNAQSGLTAQTRRHGKIVSALGVRHLIVAVNKMDLVGWSRSAFAAIEREFRAFAQGLPIDEIVFIPTSARAGDNVVTRSRNMAWYRGPTLLEHLERMEIPARAERQPFRMPVQWVNRPHADFRGYCGLLASGDVSVGQRVRVAPSGQTTRIARIATADGDLERAVAGQSVTLVLADDVDVSRGDVIADFARPPAVTDRLEARIFWMGQDALAPGRRYFIKLGTLAATATVGPSLSLVSLDSQATVAADHLLTNEIGHCRLQLDRPVAVDRYVDNRETGSFILVDPESYDTVGLGLVEGTAARPAEASGLLERLYRRLVRRSAPRPLFHRPDETHTRSIAKAVSWRVTGSLDTFLLSLIITGSAMFAGSIAATEIVTKIIFYYWHERIWSIVAWGRR